MVDYLKALLNASLSVALLGSAIYLIAYGKVVAFLFGVLYLGLASYFFYRGMEETG